MVGVAPQTQTNESVFAISAINKYMLGSRGGWRGRSGHHSVPTRMSVLKEAKDTQGINSGGSPNDNMASDFSTPQFHAINDVSLYHVWFANTIVA